MPFHRRISAPRTSSWTVPLLQEVLEIATEQWVSDDRLRRAMDRLNYVWKRPRYGLEPDRTREKNAASAGNSGSAAAQRRVAQDETDLLLFPPLHRWSNAAKTPRSG